MKQTLPLVRLGFVAIAVLFSAAYVQAQTVVLTVPPHMRILRAVDWNGSDTATLLGAGEGVIRWLDGVHFTDVSPRYDTTTFDHVLYLNDSMGVATSKYGTVVGLDLRRNTITSWPGLPSHGYRAMHYKDGFALFADSAVHLFTWQEGAFQQRTVESTKGSSAYCIVTDTTLACVVSDSLLRHVWIQQDTILYVKNALSNWGSTKFKLTWIHPINRTAVIGLTSTGKILPFGINSNDRGVTFSAPGTPEIMVGFRPLPNGEGVVQSPGFTGFSGRNDDIERGFPTGYPTTFRNVSLPIMAGITLPRTADSLPNILYVTYDGSWGFVDGNMANMSERPIRMHLRSIEWHSLNTNDGKHVAAYAETGVVSEMLGISTDGGRTWAVDSLRDLVSVRSVRSNIDGTVLFNPNQQQVIRVYPNSARRDTLWNTRRGMPLVRDIAVHGDTLLVTSIDSLGVSTNGGETWTFSKYTALLDDQETPARDGMWLAYSFRNTVWLTAQNVGDVLHTTDWGRTWKRYGGPVNRETRPVSLIRRASGQIVMAVKELDFIVLTTLDHGDSVFRIKMRVTGPVTEDWNGKLVMVADNELHEIDTIAWELTGRTEAVPHRHLRPRGTTIQRVGGVPVNLLTSGYFLTRWGDPTTSVTEDHTTMPYNTLWPNPASDYVDVKADAVVVHNLSGETVKCRETSYAGHLKLDVRELPNGVYAVQALRDGRWSTSMFTVFR